MQLAPRFLAGFPHGFPEGSPGILKRHNEKTRPQIFPVLLKRRRSLSIINLCFFPNQELQPVTLLGIFPFEPQDKPLSEL